MHFLLIVVLFSSSLFASDEFIPEASGSAKVGESLVIAGDEEPKALWVKKENVLKKIKIQGAAWDDMEGLATLNDQQFFGITSHSLTKKGKQRPEREQLFLFSLGEKISLQKTWSMRADILTFLEKHYANVLDMNEVRTASPDEGGLNIEGMTYAGGKLYLGLRSPITSQGNAIVLVLSNPAVNPELSETFTVNLEEKGIRGLETHAEKIVILSGSKNDVDEKFGIHFLNPVTRALSAWRVPGFEQLIRPESVVMENDKALIFVQDFEVIQNQEVIVQLSL
ncbi:MAG: DUF3616 domain-containing protein [Bdellovibrionota bacterium]